MRKPWAIALALALAWAPPVAAASEPDAGDPQGSIGVVPALVEGKLPDHVRAELDRKLRDSVADDARLLEGAAACADDECWRALAGEAGGRVVQATIVVVDRDFDIRADVRDETGTVVASVTRRCEICGYEELGDTIELLGNALRRKLASSVATLPVLRVTSEPSGAWVSVDGEKVGTTPLELPLAEGTHDVRISKSGHVAQIRRIALVSGVKEPIAVELVPLPAQERTTKPPTAMRAGGAVALAFGLAAVGAGIGLAVMDEKPQRSRCDGENVDIEGNCKYRYTTLEGGIAAIVVGTALLATGVALLVVARKRGRTGRVAVQRSGLSLRF